MNPLGWLAQYYIQREGSRKKLPRRRFLALAASVTLPAESRFAWAQGYPEVNMGSGPIGGPVHMTGALFNMMTGLNMQQVPYRGEALALANLMAGQVQVVFGSVPVNSIR